MALRLVGSWPRVLSVMVGPPLLGVLHLASVVLEF
jgi:hypothetical protein